MSIKEKLYEMIKHQPYGTEEVVEIHQIYIPESFRKLESRPSKEKMIKCRQLYHKKDFLDKPIEVRRQAVYTKLLLVDKYTRLCVGFEMGLTHVGVKYID